MTTNDNFLFLKGKHYNDFQIHNDSEYPNFNLNNQKNKSNVGDQVQPNDLAVGDQVQPNVGDQVQPNDLGATGQVHPITRKRKHCSSAANFGAQLSSYSSDGESSSDSDSLSNNDCLTTNEDLAANRGTKMSCKKAEEWGLVNRLAELGEALKVAEALAKEIIKKPQGCLKADRKSAYYATFDAQSYQDAFDFELNNGIPVLAEAVKGAGRFIRKEHKL